jgi:carbon-monoxide dehydrogenase medium subunit
VPVSQFLEPRSVDEAGRLLAEDPDESMAVAGGTAVTLMLRQRLIEPTRLVSLARIPGLHGIEERDGEVRVGAATTLTEVATAHVIRDRLPALAHAAGRVGNIRVRNVATMGGNVAEADYASDPPSVLASLGAECVVQGPDGVRQVAVDEFITGFYTNALRDGEVLTDVVIPTPVGRRAVYHKYVSRSSEDRPCVGVAARGDFDGATVRALDVVVGAVSARPQRLADVTGEASGHRLHDDLVDHIADEYAGRLDPMDDDRGSTWYRRQMIQVFVRRALIELAGPAREATAHG